MNISEFRGDIAEQFNIAGNGTPVFITRTGQTFKLELDEKKVEPTKSIFSRETRTCKVHGTPLANGNCLQKGCKK